MASLVRIRIAFVLLCIIWSTTWSLIALSVHDLPPLTAAATRVAVAFVALALFARSAARVEGGANPPLWLSLVMGCFNVAYSYGVIYTIERDLPSGITALLWGVFPLLMLVSGTLFLGEKLRRVHVFGFVGGFLGLGLLFLFDLRERGAGSVGAAAVLLTSPLAGAITQTCVKRFGAGASATLLTRNALGIGAVLLTIAALAFEDLSTARWTTAAILATAYLAVVATALAFVLYYWILRHSSSVRLSTISYITPVFALLIGSVWRDEPLAPSTIAGAVLVLGSVALSLRPDRAQTR
ncbi:MAG: DMT family transporter [Planctomycetota bacterium]